MSAPDEHGLLHVGRVLLAALREAAGRDEAVRNALRALHAWVGERLGELEVRVEQATAAEESAEAAEEEVTLVERHVQIGGVRASRPILVKVSQGEEGAAAALRREVAPPAPAPSFSGPTIARPVGLDLNLVRRRALLKGDVCRWAVKSRRAELTDYGTGRGPEYGELVRRAKALPDCYAFPLDGSRPLPDDEELEQLACCYDGLARGVEVAIRHAQRFGEDEAPPEDLLELLSEAQSALRIGLERIDIYKDSDQVAVYEWLVGQTRAHQIMIQRHMRLLDPADPAEWFDLRERFDAFERQMSSAEDERRRRSDLLNKLRYHVGRLKDARENERADNWTSIADVLQVWVEEGRPPSNRDLCDLLLPLIDDIPDGVEFESPALRVLKAVDELSARLEMRTAAPARERARTPEVLEAARLLRGKVVIMLGGQARRHAKRQLEEDLELAELRWIPTTAHRSLAPLEREIARPEVKLVILAIRWSDHAMGDLKAIADREGVAFLRLPGGYNPNRVAHEILSQVSEQLGE